MKKNKNGSPSSMRLFSGYNSQAGRDAKQIVRTWLVEDEVEETTTVQTHTLRLRLNFGSDSILVNNAN